MCVSIFFLEECASHNRRPCQRHPRGSDNCRIEQVRFLGRHFLPCSIFVVDLVVLKPIYVPVQVRGAQVAPARHLPFGCVGNEYRSIVHLAAPT